MLRKARKQAKRIVFGLAIIAIIVLLVIIAVYSFKSFVLLARFGSEQKNSIIKPIGEPPTRQSLSDALSKENFIMESLVEGSGSAVFIGEIKDGPKVYFSKNHDAKWQVRALELILSKLTIDNKKPTLVDLRFEQPIVKF